MIAVGTVSTVAMADAPRQDRSAKPAMAEGTLRRSAGQRRSKRRIVNIVNRTIKDILQKRINNKPSDWEDRLGDALLAYRNSVSVTTGFMPYHLLDGRHARVPLSRMLKTSQHTAFCNI